MRRMLSVLAIMLATAAVHAADWPLFRGDPLQTGAVTESLPRELKVLWTFQTKDAIDGSAAIVGDTVYIGSADQHLYALSLADGRVKWQHKLDGPIKASPAFKEWPASVQKDIAKESLLYIGDGEGVFHCLNPADGRLVWKLKTEGEIISSANFAGDKVIFGSGDETLYCLDGRTGKLAWKFQVPGGPIYPSPAVVGERTFATGCDQTLHIINVADGKEIASVELPVQVVTSPAVVGDHLYLGTMGKGVVAVDWKNAKILWEFTDTTQEFYSSAAVAQGRVVVGNRDKQLYALDAKTGALTWSFSAGRRIDSSPVIAGDRVYVGAGDGNLYCLNLKTGQEYWQQPLGSPINGSPAIAQGRLVIGTQDGIVYCLGAK